jgi:hypothetical protein
LAHIEERCFDCASRRGDNGDLRARENRDAPLSMTFVDVGKNWDREPKTKAKVKKMPAGRQRYKERP